MSDQDPSNGVTCSSSAGNSVLSTTGCCRAADAAAFEACVLEAAGWEVTFDNGIGVASTGNAAGTLVLVKPVSGEVLIDSPAGLLLPIVPPRDTEELLVFAKLLLQ